MAMDGLYPENAEAFFGATAQKLPGSPAIYF